MFTIKYTDQDGRERLTTGYDISARMDGKQARALGWLSETGEGCGIEYPTTAYVMNESGATVAKYVVIGDKLSDAEFEATRKHWQTAYTKPFTPIAPDKRAGRE